MKILLAAMSVIGHVNPILIAARILKKAGHTTALYSGSMFQAKAEAAGAKFFPLPVEADYTPERLGRMFASFPPDTPEAVRMKTLFTDPLIPQFRGLQRIIRSFVPDLIVYETGFHGILPLLLGPRSVRVPCAMLGISLLLLPREDGAPFGPGLPPATSDAQREQYRAQAAAIDAEIWDRVNAFANEELSKIGAGTLPGELFESMALLGDMILQPSMPSFEFPLRKTPEHLRFIGPLMPQGVGGVPAVVKEAKEAGRKIVLASQGTFANQDLGLLIGPTLEALSGREDILTVATTGGPSIENIPGVAPANAAAFTFLNYSEVLPLVDVLVALGGYGTVTQALSYGIPMVLAGTSEDKAENAARVAWNGAGIALGVTRPTPEQIRDAVNEILTTPGYRARAQKMAEEFAVYDAEREIPRLLEELVNAPREAAVTA